MPISFGPTFVEGKVYRTRKKNDDDDEKRAMAEIQILLNAKNRRSCDCEAQLHDLLENCLNCGRLTCVSEGPGKCFSCGTLVLAQEQRERLKKHIDISQSFSTTSDDRSKQSSSSSASRVRIIDYQFDQSAIDNKRHLREDEKDKLKENLNDLQSKRYQRKLVLNVDIDNMQASSSSQPLIDDYSAEMRKLQISRPAEDSSSTHPTLVEVLESNKSKKKDTKPTPKSRSEKSGNNKKD